jgi:hypothetical protein
MDQRDRRSSRRSGLVDQFGGGWEGPAPGRRALTTQLKRAPGSPEPSAGLVPAATDDAAAQSMDPAELGALLDAAVRPDLPTAPVMQRKVAVGGGDANAHADAASLGSGAPLPDGVRGSMEHSFGADFSAVRVHESNAASAVGARAFARGDDLCFAPGQFDPASTSGRELIGHELAHVVQQRDGRVSPATAQGDAGVVADPALEAEADELGARAARGDVVASASASGGGGATAIQRQITCNDPGSNTGTWGQNEWGGWLQVRGMTWGDLVGTGQIGPPVVLPLVNPPAPNRVLSVAHHELAALRRDPNMHNFPTLAALHTELARRTALTVMSMVNNGVAPTDLDVALDMYGRLDGRGAGDIAILHKLEWHDVHHFQYEKSHTDPAVSSPQGLVYGPWRDGGNAPSDNSGGGDVNVHTMPLNVVWLLACCHHGVSFRLFAPPNERGLFRDGDRAGRVNNRAHGGQQRKLSALAREIIAIVGTGLYNVVPQPPDPSMPPGFQDTWLLTPTPQALDANMGQLSNNNNDFDLPQLTAHLLPRGIQVIQPGTAPDRTINNTTTLHNKEDSLRQLCQLQMNNFSAPRVNTISQREQQIIAITQETLPVMRRRVLGTITATFQCNYVTQPGQRLFVVGDLEELGGWNAGRAVPLTFGGAHWDGPVAVCKDQTIRYKYLVEDSTGRHWEVGNNHVRNTTATATYQDNWGGG